MAEYNKIISTVNSITQDLTIIPDITDVMVIDTSNNRIGINTIDPDYSIHVKDNVSQNISGIISTDYLKVDEKVLTDLVPDTSNLDIGSREKQWNNIYVKNVVNDSLSTNSVIASDLTVGGNTLSVIDNNENKIKTLGYSSVHNKVDLRPEIYVHKTLDVNGINIRDANKLTFDDSNQTIKIPHNIDISKNSLDASSISIKNNAIIDRDVTIKGNITIEGEFVSDFLDQKIEGSRASIILKSTADAITRGDLYSSYRGTTRLLDFSNQDVGIRNDLSGYTFRVTVSNGKYFINGLQTPVLTLYTNTRYIFDQTDSTNNNHPFYITGGTYHNNDNDNSMVSITTPSTVGTTSYYCDNHLGMGANINLVSPYNNINIKFVDYASYSINNTTINDALNNHEHNTFNFADSIFQVTKSSEVIKMDADFSGIVIRELYTDLNLKLEIQTDFINNSMYDISLIIVLMKDTSGQLVNIDNSPVINLSSGSTIEEYNYIAETQTIAGISGDVISFGYLLYSDQYSDSSINKIKNSIFSTIDDYQSGGEYTPTTNSNGKIISTPFGDYNWYSIYYLTQYYNDSSTSFELSNNYPSFLDLSNNASNIKLQTYSDRFVDISNNKLKILNFISVPILSINVSINNLYTSGNLGNIERTHGSSYQDAHVKFKWTNIVYLINNNIIIDISMQHTNVKTNTTTYTHPNYVISSTGEIVDRDSNVNYEWSNTVVFNLNNYNIYNNDVIEIKNLLVLQLTADAQPPTHSSEYVDLTGNNVDPYYNNDGYSGQTNYSGLNNSYHRRYQTSQNATFYMRHVYNGDISFNVDIDYSNIYNFSDIEINVQEVDLKLSRETGQLFESIEVQNTLDASMIDANQINVELLKSNIIDCSFITCTDTIDCSFIKALNVDFSGIPHIDSLTSIPSGYLYKDAGNFIKIKP